MVEQIQPTTSTQFQGSKQPKISLIARDFSTIRRALLDLIRVRFPNEFKDFSTSGIGMTIVEVVAYSHAQLGYYVDAHANEFFIPTARTNAGMRRLTAGLNYRMRSATAAGVELTAFPSPVQTAKVRLDEGTVFRANNGTVWTLADTVLIPENSSMFPDPDIPTDIVIAATQGEPKTSDFQSDGTAFQKFLLPDENVVEGSIEVYVEGELWTEADSLVFSEGYGFAVDRRESDGSAGQSVLLSRLWPRTDNFMVSVGSDPNTAVTWTQVDDFLSSGPSDTHYVVDIDPTSGESTVLFGDGANGAIPTDGELIVMTYNVIGPQRRYQVVLEPDALITVRFGDGDGAVIPPTDSEIQIKYSVGGGLKGNVAIGEIDTDIQGFNALTGDPVSVRIQNQSAAFGAEAAETVDHARLFAPKVAGSTGRASTQNDWDGLINSFVHDVYGAVAFGRADLHSDFPESNQVDLVLWTRDSDGRIFPAPETFREAVKVYMETRADICHYIRHKGGDTIYVDVYADIAIPSNLDVPGILNRCRTAISNYFLSTQVLPGKDVHKSQLVTIIQQIEGVSYVVITQLRLSRRTNETYLLGDGVSDRYRTETFDGYYADLGAPIIAGSFKIESGDNEITDDGSGGLTGDVSEDAEAANEIVYDDEFTEKTVEPNDMVPAAGAGLQGPRFFTPWFSYKRYEIPTTNIDEATGHVGSVSPEELPNSDFNTLPGTLVVTDGIQYAYDNNVMPAGSFIGDVNGVATNDISPSGTGNLVEIEFTFANPITGPKVVAYYIYEEVDFSGAQRRVSALDQPVRPSTFVARIANQLVVDNGDGKFEWDAMSADPLVTPSDDRNEANTILYADQEVEDEDFSVWVDPLDSTKYRGRLLDVPVNPNLSPQIQPNSIVISDSTTEVRDDGSGNLTGDSVDEDGINKVFYEDTDVVDDVIAEAGNTVFSGIALPLNIMIPGYMNGGSTLTFYFQIETQVVDGVGGFHTVVLQDTNGDGSFDTITVTPDLPNPSPPPASLPDTAVLVSGLVNYAVGELNLELAYDTTLPLRASYRVRGGTFDLSLSTSFSSSPTVNYRKANGGEFDITFDDENGVSGQDLLLRWDQALGGQFDFTWASAPGVNDVVSIDYRFRYELNIGANNDSEVLKQVLDTSTVRIRGQLDAYPIKRGSLQISGTDNTGSSVRARDDGGGNIVGESVASTGKNYIDYDTGVYDVTFQLSFLFATQVFAAYTAYLDPEDFVPVLDDQMADVANIDLTRVEPRDY